VLKDLTKNELTNDEHAKITEKIIEEGDIDNGKSTRSNTIHNKFIALILDGKLSFLEFETVMKRSPDFINTFHIRI
jgi:hypothetical protein